MCIYHCVCWSVHLFQNQFLMYLLVHIISGFIHVYCLCVCGALEDQNLPTYHHRNGRNYIMGITCFRTCLGSLLQVMSYISEWPADVNCEYLYMTAGDTNTCCKIQWNIVELREPKEVLDICHHKAMHLVDHHCNEGSSPRFTPFWGCETGSFS